MKRRIGLLVVGVILLTIGLTFRTRKETVASVSQAERKKYGETIFNYLEAEIPTSGSEVKKIKLILAFYGQEVDKEKITVYLNQTISGLDKSGQEIYGSDFPVVYTLKKQKGTYNVTSYEEPRDGSFYEEDLKRMFPEKKFGVWNKLKRSKITFESDIE